MATASTSATPATRRVLKGYGPLALASLLFLLMAMFVPTVGQSEEATGVSAGAPGSLSSTDDTIASGDPAAAPTDGAAPAPTDGAAAPAS